MEPKFKIGNRVRVLECEGLDAAVRGADATVQGIVRATEEMFRQSGQPYDSDAIAYTLDVDFGVGTRTVIEGCLEPA